MAKKNKVSLIIMCVLFWVRAFSQTNDGDVLALNDFMVLVKKYHPIAKQASLLLKNAEANTLYSKGNFDPKLFYDLRSKFYNATNYYDLGNGGISIPTWYGIEFKAGYENNDGQYINPENKLPDNGLVYSQISFPVLQGLIIDERRAALKKAKLFETLSQFEKTNLLNELLYNAGKSYWEWQLSYSNLKVIDNAANIAQQRFLALVKTVQFGDRPPIDTVEAKIQLQERQVSLQQAKVDLITRTLMLSNYLWNENNVPALLNENIKPEFALPIKSGFDSYQIISDIQIDSIIHSHPELKMYEYKIKQFDIDRKLKQDKLKPKINLNYNPLYKPDNLQIGNFNNYKWGVSMAFPLFLRKERGDLQMIKIKIERTRYETANKRIELINKSKASINQLSSLVDQLTLYGNAVDNQTIN